MIKFYMFNGSGKNKPVIKKAMVELDGMCTFLVFSVLSVLETSVTSLFKVILFARNEIQVSSFTPRKA